MHDTVLQTLEAIALQPASAVTPSLALHGCGAWLAGMPSRSGAPSASSAGDQQQFPALAYDLAALAGPLRPSGCGGPSPSA